MSIRTIKRIIQVFGVLHFLASFVLLLGSAYCLFSSGVKNGWLLFPWLFAGGSYFLWLGYRGCKSPSPRVVRQLCTTMFLIGAIPFLVLFESEGWSEDSVAVMLPSALIVFGGFWLSTFGSRMFCSRLFTPEN